MWFYEHALVSTAVFGLSPSAYLGSLLPDSFTYLKWLNNVPTGVINIKNFFKSPKTFKKIAVTGKFAELNQISHSIFILIPMAGIALYAKNIFAAAWTLHVIVDYLTHKKEIYPLFPVNRKWEFPFSIDFYNYSNFKLVFVADFLLIAFAVLRIVL